MNIEERLDYLIAHTSLAEKVSQLQNDAPEMANVSIPRYNWLNEGIHGVCGPREIGGFRDTGAATSWPNGCGLGATWHPELLNQVSRAIGIEARGKHNGFVHTGNRVDQMGLTFYTPNMNLVKDPRWGRAQEVYSEDPYLSSRLTIAYVTGLQDGPDDSYLLAGACCKHYAAYDLDVLANGTDRTHFNAIVNVRNMWETFLPVFKACVVEAQSSSVMCSYNSINGVPTCGDPDLMNGILRDQWKWDGFVMSDYDAVANILYTHHYVSTELQATSLAMNSGCDQEGGGDMNANLVQAVQQGMVKESTINEAFRRLFRTRMRLGMLDPPTMVGYNYLVNDTTVVQSPQHVQLARDTARESICLYKNNAQTLPLDVTKLTSIAVIGPHAPQTWLLLGNYNGYPTKIVSILEGIVNAVNFTNKRENRGRSGNCTFEQDVDYFVYGQSADVNVDTAQACCDACSQIFGCTYFTFYQGGCYFKYSEYGKTTSVGRVSGKCNNGPPLGIVNYALGCAVAACPDTSQFNAAIQAAKQSDVVILTLGLDETIESEGNDRTSLTLPGYQPQLLQAIRQAIPNKPLIGVLIHGGSITLQNNVNNLDALIDAWYPGMEGGNAIADVLFGYYNPAGRTAVTWYQDISQLPDTANMDLYAENGRTYRYFKGEVLYPFGYGLSYTTFAYKNLKVNPLIADPCTRISVEITVKNTGNYDGDEVVQLYINKTDATVPSPQIRLAGFERIHLLTGQSTKLEFVIEPEWHSVVYDGDDIYNGQVMVEAGFLNIFVGGGQPDYFTSFQTSHVKITDTVPLSTCGA